MVDVSVRGQTVIPSEVRRRFGITPGARLRWEVRDQDIVVHPVPQDPVSASLGALKGKALSLEAFFQERRKEKG